jgi:hypothetical protein
MLRSFLLAPKRRGYIRCIQHTLLGFTSKLSCSMEVRVVYARWVDLLWSCCTRRCMCKRFTLVLTVVVRCAGGCHRAFFVGAELLKDLHKVFHADAAGVVFIFFLLGFRGALQESLDDGAVLVLISVAMFLATFLVVVRDFRYSHALRRIRVVLCQLGRDVHTNRHLYGGSQVDGTRIFPRRYTRRWKVYAGSSQRSRGATVYRLDMLGDDYTIALRSLHV